MTGRFKTMRERLDERSMPEPNSGCTLWLGATNQFGYGLMWQPRTDRAGGMTSVHRIAYELERGPIPAGLVIDHRCFNHSCINVAHLEAVPLAVNLSRRDPNHARRVQSAPNTIRVRNADATHCAYGHAYDASNTRLTKKGGKTCRACNRAYQRAFLERRAKERAA